MRTTRWSVCTKLSVKAATRVLIMAWLSMFSSLQSSRAEKQNQFGQAYVEHEQYNPTVCADVLQRNGCYKRWEYLSCDSMASHIPRTDISDANEDLNKYDTEPSTFILATADAVSSGTTLAIKPNDESWTDETFLRGLWDGGLDSLIPGVWTLDDLLVAENVTTALGLLVNEDDCCFKTFTKRENGQVTVESHSFNHTWRASVVSMTSLCNGSNILWVDHQLPIAPIEEDAGEFEHWADLLSLPLFNDMLQGGCNASSADIFSEVNKLVSPQAQLGGYAAAINPPLNHTVRKSWEVSVTWFVARQNSLTFTKKTGYSIVGSELDAEYDKTASSFEECSAKCRSQTGCKGFTFTGETLECLLKETIHEGDLRVMSGTDVGLLGLSVQDYQDSCYLLYHMIPGSYCEDDLVAAGSINTLLGVATGEYLPLTFNMVEDGKITVSAASAAVGLNGTTTATRTLTVVNRFSSCRSMFYILSDDYFPPASTQDAAVPDLEDTWEYLSNATRQYRNLVWNQECFNPLGGTPKDELIHDPGDELLSAEQYTPEVCADIMHRNRCYKRWEYIFCEPLAQDMKNVMTGQAALYEKHDAMANVHMYADKYASERLLASGTKPFETLWNTTHDQVTFVSYLSAWGLNRLIPGVYTLDELVAAENVSTSLGLYLDDEDCCQKHFIRRPDGQVVIREYNHNKTWEVGVVQADTLCDGSLHVWLDEFQVTIPDIEDRPEFQELFGVNPVDLPLFNGMIRGGCNITVTGMLYEIDKHVADDAQLTPNLQRIDPSMGYTLPGQPSSFIGESWEISVTWFVAEKNSLAWVKKAGRRAVGVAPLDGGVERLASGFEECGMQCRMTADCYAFQHSAGTGACILNDWIEEDDLEDVEGTDVGMPGLSVATYDDSRYLLYHTIPGSYCEDDLVAAGSINTLLGEVTGEYLPLTFGTDEHGQVTVTAPSSVVDPNATYLHPIASVNRTLTVVNHFTSCRSLIYILSDDYFPPASTRDAAVPDLEDTWEYLSNATRQYHDLVWREECFNPLAETWYSWATINTSSSNSNDQDAAVKIDGGGNEHDGGGTLAGGAIASIVIGSLAVVGLIAAGIAFVVLRRRRGSSRGLDMAKSEALSVGDNKTAQPSAYVCLDKVPRDWVINDIKLLKQVGSGSFGSVHIAQWHRSVVAVKRFTTADLLREESDKWQEQLLEMRKEVSIMSGLRHPNVVQFLGVTIDPPAVVMEFCHYGSLYGLCHKASGNPSIMSNLTWLRRLNMAMDAAKGMHFLHSREVPIIHRDLKSPNLLVDKSWNVKVSDFGLSKIVDLTSTHTSITAFNPRWLAPEAIDRGAGSNGRTTVASDMYSFGIIMWELLTLRKPFDGLDPAQIVFAVVANRMRPPIPDVEDLPGFEVREGQQAQQAQRVFVEQYIGLMQRCWHQDPAQRPTFNTVMDHLRDIIQSARSAEGAPSSMAMDSGTESGTNSGESGGSSPQGSTPPYSPGNTPSGSSGNTPSGSSRDPRDSSDHTAIPDSAGLTAATSYRSASEDSSTPAHDSSTTAVRQMQ